MGERRGGPGAVAGEGQRDMGEVGWDTGGRAFTESQTGSPHTGCQVGTKWLLTPRLCLPGLAAGGAMWTGSCLGVRG